MHCQRHRTVALFARGFLYLIPFIALGAPSATAQVYLYGRADFSAGTTGDVIVADFNGDGLPDLAVSDPQNSAVDILLGATGGGFVLSGTYPTGSGSLAQPSGSLALVAADFNHDNKLDLAVVNESDGTISILLGNGDGTFQSQAQYPVGEQPAGIVAADFNHDGKVDLATISEPDNSVAILWGNGRGGFETQALIPLASPSLIAGGDTTGDGRTDLITYNGQLTVLVNQGKGNFTQVQSPAPFSTPSQMFVGDFNGDGKLDVFWFSSYGLYLSLGNGDGSFQSPVSIPNGPSNFNGNFTPTATVGDFNHDGKLDIALSGVYVMLGNGDGTFQNPVLSPALTNPVAVANLNSHLESDLICYQQGVITALLGQGNGTFMDLQSPALNSTSNPPGYGVAADFNGDGKLDLAVIMQNYPSSEISVELGKGNGKFGQPIVSSLLSDGGYSFALTADFNGDHKADFLALDSNNWGFQVALGNGDGTFATPVDTPLTNPIYAIAAGDFNGDGKADLVATTSGYDGSYLTIYLGNGDGSFTQGQQYVIYSNSYVTVADVNSDGKLDLVVMATGESPDTLLVFLGNGNGTFSSPIFGPSLVFTSQAVVADFNGDGKVDVVTAGGQYYPGGIIFLPGNGNGTFGNPIYSDAGLANGSLFTAADVNGDGKLDLVQSAFGCCNFTSAFVNIGNGDGTFGPPQEYDTVSSGFGAIGAVVGDFNGDGVADVGLPGYPSSTPVVFLYLSSPAPNLSPSSVDFGHVPVGNTSKPRKVLLTNSGNAKMKISGVTVSGDFTVQNDCRTYVPVGKSCAIHVQFKPSATGVRNGILSVADNAPGSPHKVSLTGTGE
ncbi:MAG TPA: FG-GAP-like repeat-containing protein [Terriglobales bacterium]